MSDPSDYERKKVIEYLRAASRLWKDEAKRLRRNPSAAECAEAKQYVLEGVADDIENKRHLP